MKMQDDLEQLRKRIGLIEHDLDDARRRLSQLELRLEVDESASVEPTLTRTRPCRMLGLLGLAVCVPRLFMVDLDSALHRIAALVVLGLVLLWVGFSYHRFRHLITEAPEEKLP